MHIKRVSLFLGMSGIGAIIITGIISLTLLFSLGPVGQMRYMGQKFIPAHAGTRSVSRVSGYRKGRPQYSSVTVPTWIPDKWYLTVSYGKDKTRDLEITQPQYDAGYLKDKVWPNYNAFKKEFKEIYGEEPGGTIF
jgi:hypothetical protein